MLTTCYMNTRVVWSKTMIVIVTHISGWKDATCLLPTNQYSNEVSNLRMIRVLFPLWGYPMVYHVGVQCFNIKSLWVYIAYFVSCLLFVVLNLANEINHFFSLCWQFGKKKWELTKMQTLVFYKSVQINQLSIIYKKKKTNIELTTYNLNSSLKIIIMDVWSTM